MDYLDDIDDYNDDLDLYNEPDEIDDGPVIDEESE